MVFEMFIDSTSTGELQDCGRLVKFMESTEFNKMSPHDDLNFGETDYVLAKPGDCYIAYASGITTNLGIRNLTKGEYTLKWFDCKDGDTEIQTVNIDTSGNHSWNKPSGMGDEVALYIKRSGGLSGLPSVITSPSSNAGIPGQELIVPGTEDNIAPVAKDKMVQTGQNESTYIQLLYEDPDSGPGPYTISIVKQPVHGSLSGTGNDQTYIPNKGFTGRDSFEWKVSDGKDDSNIATVTIQ